MNISYTIPAFVLLTALSKESSYFIPRLIGILLGSSVLGFLIGSSISIIVVGLVRTHRNSGEFPIKKVMMLGGFGGALVADISLLILML